MEYDFQDTEFSRDAVSVLEDPFALLALSLSCPFTHQSTEQGSPSTTVTVHDDRVEIARPPRKNHDAAISPIVASKDTYFQASILLDKWLGRADRKGKSKLRDRKLLMLEDSLRGDCMRMMDKTARHRCQPSFESPLPTSLIDCLRMVSDDLYGRESNVSYDSDVLHRANRSLLDLEAKGLVVDPAFAGAEGAIVLLGLIPVRFSNRTGRGDNVFRELKIQAALWEFSYESRLPIRGKRFERSWSLNVRGVKFIRGLLTDMAQRFLAAEADDRREHDEPVMPSPRNIEFNDNPDENA